MIVDFFTSSYNQQDSDQIKTEINEDYVRCKMINFLYFRHDLRNPEKQPDSGHQQQNAPNQLKR